MPPVAYGDWGFLILPLRPFSVKMTEELFQEKGGG
jgi:hypothetical protein